MKNPIIAALLAATPYASAANFCVVSMRSAASGNSLDQMTFDHIAYTGDISSPKYVVVKKGSQVAEEVDVDQLDSYRKWRAINGATFITFNQQEDGLVSITVGQVDISKRKNMLPLEAIATGSLSQQQAVTLFLPKRNIALSCASRN